MAEPRLDNIIELAKRRGLFFPSAEIYPASSAGTWEYGPLGLAIKRRLESCWRTFFVTQDRMLEIQGASILPEDVFIASGHIKSFADPLTQCQTCKTVYRADKLVGEQTGTDLPECTPLSVIDQQLKALKIRCPRCGGALNEARHFNLMFRLAMGATMDNTAYLRPETCQNIFINFNRLYRALRQKLPFGVAQIGDSFRNEISPRRGLIRMRQFTQAEAEVFFNPQKINKYRYADLLRDYPLRLLPLGYDAPLDIPVHEAVEKGIVKGDVIAYYLARLQQFLEYLQVPREAFRYHELNEQDRPFYALQAFDLELLTSWGWQEIAGNHYRTDHDLHAHMEQSKKDLTVIEDDNQKVLPHVWEFSLGIDRLLMVLLDRWYQTDTERTWLQIPSHLAPVDAAIFPLVKKDAALVEKARTIEAGLRNQGFSIVYDERDTVGRRYARVDEIGCPYAITIDRETLTSEAATIRHRDTKTQERLNIDEIGAWLRSKANPPLPITIPLLDG